MYSSLGQSVQSPGCLRRDQYVIVLVSLFFIVAQAVLALSPAVNLEFAFVGAAEYFGQPNELLIEQYFSYQANTLGMSYLAHCVSTLFSSVDMLFLMRMISVLGLPFLLVGVYRVNRYIGINSFFTVAALIVLNPLVWAFSGRATADFMPAALGFFAISIALGKERVISRSLLAGAFLGLAAVLKYHVLCLLPLLAGLLVYKEGFGLAFKKLLIATLVSLLILSFYLFKVHEVFGFWLAPEKYKAVHNIKLSNVLNNFVLYFGFLVMLAAPALLLSRALWREMMGQWKLLVVLLSGMAVLGWLFFHETGELNLGPLDTYVSEKFRVVGFSLLFVLGWVLVFFKGRESERVARVRVIVGLSMLFVILALSISRPAQRYLLFVLPFFVMILPRDILKERWVLSSTLTLFVLANAFIEINKWSAGTASVEMLEVIEAKGLVQETNPGAIGPSVGNAFFEYSTHDKSYLVVPGAAVNAIAVTHAGPRFLGRTFSLIKIKN